ncbi:BTAD domain-containing putative transcriptional regulator [Kibdelosporangium lantanae]
MRVGILGPLEVTADGRPVEIGGARLRVLLVRLAVAAPRVVTVEELADALWPEERPADEVSSVRTLVSRLRRALPDPSALQSVPGGYRLDLPADAVDAHRFDRLARNARRELAQGNATVAVQQLRAALGLWRGPALADAARSSFAAGYVAGLDEAKLAATEDRAEAELAAGHQDHLVTELAELAVRYPLRERLQGLLLLALCAEGRQAEALKGYEEVRRRLADELGADPGPELRDVHQTILQGTPAPEKPRGGNLRVALTSFVGRTAEVERVGDMLANGRLVTLVGPGGAGKTRLATTVAGGIRVPGGVWLVELAGVTDPAEVPLAVLGVVGTRETRNVDTRLQPRDAMTRMVEALGRSETVIVLDNCEHVVDAAARLADELLGQIPKLRILATSREPLGVFGETLCPVPPLPVPEPGVTAEEAMATPAVRLLAERAAAVRPGFTVTDENVATVVDICRRLDGLPLAIELAAARLRSLTADELAGRLDDRFRLLTGGSRTALPRHQTLRAVVAWSWDLMDEPERRFAERLAVFPGGITLAAAESVDHPDTALGLLTALVDKSLLQISDGPGLRYRMLETIREFALERLADRGEAADARAAHAAYYLTLAEAAEPKLRGRDQVAWAAVMNAERDNITTALHFASSVGDADTAIRIAAALCTYWTIQGRRTESVAWLRLALDTPGDAPEDARTLVQAMYLINKAISGGFDRLEDVLAPFQQVTENSRGFPDHPMLALIEPLLGLFTDDLELGLAAVDSRLGHPDPWTRAVLWMVRASLRENEGDMNGMRTDMPVAVEAFRSVGERFGLAQSLASLAEAHLVFGELDEAVAGLEESMRLQQELDANEGAQQEATNLAVALIYQGDVARGKAILLDVLSQKDQPTHTLAFAATSIGDIARLDGDLAEAERMYALAEDTMTNAPFSSPQFRSITYTAKAKLSLARNDIPAAWTEITAAANAALEASDMPVLSRVGVATARLRLQQGDPAVAARTLGAAERLRGAPDPCNPDIVLLVRALRSELGDAGYDAAYAQGTALDRAEAIDHVRLM